ncbi:MAG: RHS repeat-associated core domain-containing protein, partial [Anaerolineae bacterium]
VSNWGSLVSTQTAYDGLGRVIQVVQADGTTMRTYYHKRQTAVIDAANHQAISESDAFGRLVSVKQYDLTLAAGAAPNWGATVYGQASYSYDVADRLTQMTGPDGAVTTIGYDLLGRKTSMSDPDMGAWSYAYDGAGNLKRQADARGQQICFYYDSHNRLVGKHYRNDQSCPATKPATYGTNGLLVAYLYDGGTNGLGRRTQADIYNAGGALNNRVAWTYDARGRVTQESRVINGTGGGTFVTQWGYDSADRPVWMKYPGGNGGQVGEQVSFTYTAQGLLNTVIGSATYVGGADYNALGQVTQRRLGSTTGIVKQSYTYTAAENFRLVTSKAGNADPYTNLQNISYTYDDVGNVLTIADAAAYGGSQTQKFTYDTLNRLSTACTLSGGSCAISDGSYGSYSQRSYAFDNAGNLTTWSGVAFTYQNAAHKHALTHVGGVQKYWYDANGNATRRISGSQDVTLTYDAENRLTAMSGGVTSSYVYDGDGNRVKETIGGVTRVFVGNTYEVDNGTVKKYYYAGNVRVAERSGGVLYFLLSDHLGSTALTLDSSGNRLNTNTELRYYPWGGGRHVVGTTPTSFNFTGQRKDGGSGLLFYNTRWYDPTVGRFIQADTIVSNPGDPQNLNRYAYAANNPLRFVDPSGHRECEDADCRKTWPARPPNPSIPSLPFGIPPNAVPTTTPVITTYWTPQYDPQPDAAGTLTADPNLWADRGRGSPRRNAALQGSIVVQGKIWKYILATDSFLARGSPRNNGVPVNYGWVVPPDNKLGRTPEGRYILQVTAAVAYTCPHNVHCGLGTPFEPAYRRGNKPEYTIYVVTDGNVLIVTPLDTGYGLSANQIDIYMGIDFEQPDWIWGSNAHPQAYIVP